MCPLYCHTLTKVYSNFVAGGASTGAAVNPARALGPAIVFHCHWNKVWLYVIAGKLCFYIQDLNQKHVLS